nr:desulfoferrodoxin family protein [Lebetimonas sp. JH292]
MPKINRYEDISQIDREAKRDYIDRNSPFIHCEDTAKKDEKFKVKVKVGQDLCHPADFDYFIANMKFKRW